MRRYGPKETEKDSDTDDYQHDLLDCVEFGRLTREREDEVHFGQIPARCVMINRNFPDAVRL